MHLHGQPDGQWIIVRPGALQLPFYSGLVPSLMTAPDVKIRSRLRSTGMCPSWETRRSRLQKVEGVAHL